MRIWYSDFTLDDVNSRSKHTMMEFLGITFTAIGDDYMTASMPVDERTKQPLGIMHGGASCVLAETVGSTAAACCVDLDNFYTVGLDINTNHLRMIKSGEVFGTAKPFHLGKSTQVWGIEIRDAENKLISISRLTVAVLKRS